ncbi:unnamed protein product, partial [Urochloa humidicola]
NSHRLVILESPTPTLSPHLPPATTAPRGSSPHLLAAGASRQHGGLARVLVASPRRRRPHRRRIRAAVFDLDDRRNSAAVPAVSDRRNHAAVPAISDRRNHAAIPAVSDCQNSAAVPTVSDRRNSAAVPAVSDRRNHAAVRAVSDQEI